MNLPPLITSRTNARVKELRASLAGDARKPGDLLGLEGKHLVGEAHLAGCAFETVFLREGSESLPEAEGWAEDIRARQWVRLSRAVFDSTVTTSTPQGIAATWTIRDPAPRAGAPANALVLENLQDPGNLGTLLRSAEAFGISRVLVTPDTVNQWNPKVLRSAAGSVLRIPVVRAPLEELLAKLRTDGVRIFAAVARFSGEAATASPYAASRSYDTDFRQPCAILIGNEGAGLSASALALADEQVSIPSSGTESLNAAVAGAILMYESMRQISLRTPARGNGLRS